MDIFRTHIYIKKSARLLNDEEVLVAEQEITRKPDKWPIISGTGGVRKARAARGNAGKSGGVRIMYYYWLDQHSIYMLDIYAKNEKENLSSADKHILKRLITELKETKNG